jgi:uncharacterized coiled-coil DUF342 family protein
MVVTAPERRSLDVKKPLDPKSQRIGTLASLITVLRKQADGMRATIAEKDARIDALEVEVKSLRTKWDEIDFTEMLP